MNFINDLLPDQLLHALGWTFIHSLWQGVLIALIVGCFFLIFKKRAARIRYSLAVGSLVAIFILSVSTFVRYYSDSPGDWNPELALTGTDSTDKLPLMDGLNPAGMDEVSLANPGISGFFKEFSGHFNRHFPIVVYLWIFGIIFFILKLLGGLIYSDRIKFVGINPFPETWSKNISALKSKLQVTREVKIVESCLARVPMVIGYFKPVILIPLGVLSGIPQDQMEAIIAHELAHIRRHDFLVNIFQSLVESIFFYHPAIWWISGIIRKEREHCCDDLAVSVCDKSIVYAKALANLQERSYDIPCYAVALSRRRYTLLSRIKRLNQTPVTRINPIEKWMTLGLMMIIISFLSASLRIHGYDQATAAINPMEEMTLGFYKIASNDFISEVPDAELQDTLKKSGTSEINTHFFDASDQKEKEVRMIFDGKQVIELYIDGDRIPDDQLDQYQELIDNTLQELEEAEEEMKQAEIELRDAERTLEEVDFEQINAELEMAKEEVEKAMLEMKEIDMEKISHEMQQAREEFHKAFEQMQMEIEQSWHDFDTSEINRDLQRSLGEIKRSIGEFNQQFMHELREEMEETRRAIHESMDDQHQIQRDRQQETDETQQQEFQQQETQDRERTRQWEEAEAIHRDREQELVARERNLEESRRSRETETVEREKREATRAVHALEEQLMKDGIYSEGDPIDFELSIDKLLINSKKQPKKMFEEYKKIYEDLAGSIPEEVKIIIKK
jgi:bla regulator protein BlaR1